MKRIVLILFVLASLCSCDDELSPKCQALQDNCDDLLRKMKNASTEKEKENFYQFYLTEKHELNNCTGK